MSLKVLGGCYSGIYKYELYDKSDGWFTGVLNLKLNPKSSIVDSRYASYYVDFTLTHILYSSIGIAAANGNNLALYFEATGNKKNPDDRRVGIVTILLDKDKSGKDTIRLHKFYYGRSYKGNRNYGFENRKKIG